MSGDDVAASINETIRQGSRHMVPVPNRERRRKAAGGRRRFRNRGVALHEKPWTAPSFPQVYDIDKRGNVRGTN